MARMGPQDPLVMQMRLIFRASKNHLSREFWLGLCSCVCELWLSEYVIVLFIPSFMILIQFDKDSKVSWCKALPSILLSQTRYETAWTCHVWEHSLGLMAPINWEIHTIVQGMYYEYYYLSILTRWIVKILSQRPRVIHWNTVHGLSVMMTGMRWASLSKP